LSKRTHVVRGLKPFALENPVVAVEVIESIRDEAFPWTALLSGERDRLSVTDFAVRYR
jgi:hypothetical protein